MQNQEFYHPSSTPEESPTPSYEYQRNTDPREQPEGAQEYPSRSYEEGYSGLNEQDFWSGAGEKLRPEPKNQKNMGGLLAVIALVCAAFIAGSLFGFVLSWLTWIIVAVLIIAGMVALATNWRVVTVPMPTRTFQIMEHARLVINNGSGAVSIRRGNEGMISVAAIKRASGIGIDTERMQINYNQYGDTLDISSHMNWSFLQFGLRTVDFEITVPPSCDVQLQNGGGAVTVQDTRGVIRVRTGGGSIEARGIEGQIAMKTSGGHIEANNVRGLIDMSTGGGSIDAQNLEGKIAMKTGGSHIVMGNVRGQLTAHTGGGRVEVNQSTLRGESSVTTGGGKIIFDGSLDATGSYKFQTGGGGITLGLPADSAFSLNARTGGGGIHNEFGRNEVGNEPRAQLNVKTGGGTIRIMRKPVNLQ
jgi:hypothetical protein